MRIGIDVSPLQTGHKVRGVGFYLKHLKDALVKYFPQHEYTFFTQKDKVSISVDVVHYPYFEPFFLTLPLYKKYKTVITVHDLTPLVFSKHFPVGKKGYIKWQIQKFNLKRANAIITDSQSSKKDIEKIAGIHKDKIHVVYLAAGEEFKKIPLTQLPIANIQKKYNLPDKFVLYVGDVTWNKNLPRLIEAIKKINVPLVMVGKALVDTVFDRKNPWNSDRIKILDMIKEQDSIIRLGFISSEELVTLYNIATTTVVPSLYEGFGLPIVEAMSCGCPVITTKESSLPEVAGSAAWYIDGYDTDTMAEGIKKVFSNTQLQKELSEKGLEQAKKFSWEKTAKDTVAVYEKVLHNL